MPDDKNAGPAHEEGCPECPTTASQTETPSAPGHDPYAAFRFKDYRYYAAGNLVSVMGREMLAVAVGWEIFTRTHSATALGLIGLTQALPIILLAIPAGHAADRLSRKSILLVTQLLTALGSLGLAVISLNQVRVEWMFALLLMTGCGRTFNWAAQSSFMPNLVPAEAYPNAVAWNSNQFQIGSVAGPAIGGFLVALFGFPIVYGFDAVCAFSFFLLLIPITVKPAERKGHSGGFRELFSGIRFVWNTEIILATITLDLFAVLLGGATALLPIFAADILHCGPIGLGWLRAAPAFGSVAMGLAIAHLPPMRQAGKTLIRAVAGFGVATIIFGLSRWFWLSIGMLFLTGAFDNVSVVVRHSLVQLLTPDGMRGRVSAVNNVFIGSSNELGAFESGITAAWFGPVVSVVGGGLGTILVVAAAVMFWPSLWRLGAFGSMRPESGAGESPGEPEAHA